MLLTGRTAIVYGASGAVGKAVARAFLREGATVVLSARRREPLDRVAEVFVMRDGKIAERRAWVIPLQENDYR